MLYRFDLADKTTSQSLSMHSPQSLGIKEKDIEEFFAAHLHEIIPEDQLMLIGQERQYQEEADLFALDRDGTLYIFEIKRWPSQTDNLLQVMRYGQIFGRYDYPRLQDLAQRHQKLDGELKEKHKTYFDLNAPLPESEFNQNQMFVVVTNGVERDTLDAIRYWSQKGVEIQSLTYRFYKIEDQIHIWFDVYNPEQNVIIEETPSIYCVNTNATYMETAWCEMLSKNRASAYYDRKYAVSKIPKGSLVYLYHTGTGIIARGITTGTVQKTNYESDVDEEFFVPLKFSWKLDNQADWERAVRAWEINNDLGEGNKFRQACFGMSKKMAATIDKLWEKKNPSSKQ